MTLVSEDFSSVLPHPDEELGLSGVAVAQLALLIARLNSLTVRCYSGFLPWWTSGSSDHFPSSPTLQRIRIIVPEWFHNMILYCAILDDTFSDTDRYPSLLEFEIRSLEVPNVRVKNWETHIRLCLDEYFPRLKALGRLAVAGT